VASDPLDDAARALLAVARLPGGSARRGAGSRQVPRDRFENRRTGIAHDL